MFLIIFVAIARVCFCRETDEVWFLQNGMKHEEYIPMRDGVKLYTVIYAPKDKSERHPILMERSHEGSFLGNVRFGSNTSAY